MISKDTIGAQPNSLGQQIKVLQPEQLTHARYAPYGWLLGPPNSIEPVRGEQFTASWWRVLDLSIEGTPEIVFARMPARPIDIRRFERHLRVTQSFVPLNGDRFLQVVASPSEGPELDIETLRVFIIDGSTGLAMKKGTWHVEFFPLGATGDFLVITRSETSAALASGEPDMLVGDTDYWSLPEEYKVEIGPLAES